MSTEHPATDDPIQAAVLSWAEATYNDPREHTVPMATTDAEEVIRSQLTENTGTHFLDSGSAYGRHWEENQENPPWERPRMDVGRGYVVQNVYDFMSQRFGRDRTCVALEVCLWALADGIPALSDMDDLAELTAPSPRELSEELEVPREIAAEAYPILKADRKAEPPMSWNTYNQECGSLSQCLQGTTFGGPYAEYAMIQVHQGADIRGGYAAPRVYAGHSWTPMEFEFRCRRCEWVEYESCLLWEDDEELIYQRSIDPFELEDEGYIDEGDESYPALETAHEANEADRFDGAVFHVCDDGELGSCQIH